MARRITFFVGLLLIFTAVAIPLPSWADARTEQLVQYLSNSGNYRTRIQAAQSLGRIRDPQTVPALIRALSDDHAAVRVAVALALGRIGSPDALPYLRRLAAQSGQPPEVVSQCQRAVQQIQQMSSMSSRSGGGSSSSGGGSSKVRFYLGVGTMGNTTGRRSGELEKTLAGMVRSQLGKANGVKLAPDREPLNQTKRILKSRGWTGYFIQGSVTRLDQSGGQVHAVVSVMVLSNPGRDLRMMLQGRGSAGTRGGKVPSSQLRGLENAALEGAVKGAISRLTSHLKTR